MERAVTLEQFYMGRDKAYGEEWTIQIARNGIDTVGRINAVLEIAAADDVLPQSVHPFGYVASGWRPKAVNDKTSNAGKLSPHIYALACDLHDWLDRRFARWCLRNLDALEKVGLWMEMPRWTGGARPWVHLQGRPPVSGRRVFIPSSAPPLALALPEETALG